MDLINFISESNNSASSYDLLNSFLKFLNFSGITRFIMVDLSYDYITGNDRKLKVVTCYPLSEEGIEMDLSMFDYESIYREALRGNAPLIWEEVRDDNISRRLLKITDHESGEPTFSGIGIPIHQPLGRVIGMVFTGLENKNGYNRDTISLLQAASHQFYLVYSALIAEEQSVKNETLLSEREREVLRWISLGKSKSETASILSLSESSIKRHCENIFIKLGVKNLPSAVAKAVKSGLINFMLTLEFFL